MSIIQGLALKSVSSFRGRLNKSRVHNSDFLTKGVSTLWGIVYGCATIFKARLGSARLGSARLGSADISALLSCPDAHGFYSRRFPHSSGEAAFFTSPGIKNTSQGELSL